LAAYLSRIHAVKRDSCTLYRRKIRDIIGHGECLMGVFDSYPDGVLRYEEMAEIEKRCIDWRARLKPLHKRLCQVHGDFHPGNIWFQGKELVLLDRSRGPWGDAADDVTALTINYIFSSVRHRSTLEGAYLEALKLFFKRYRELTGDDELLNVLGPFYAFRGAVVANPRFYPELTDGQRAKIFRFVNNVLASERFEPEEAPDYLL
jgi:aminoglycoside phosphotransferase (APT) family kinase protein